MIDISGRIRCDKCGVYVNLMDLADDTAYNQMILPDSEYSKEEYESYCSGCYSREKRERDE